MRYYYRLMIAIAAAVALGAMAAFGGGSAEAHGPDHVISAEVVGGVCWTREHTHPGQSWGRTVEQRDPTGRACATPTPTPTPEAPPAEMEAPDDPIVGVAQRQVCHPRGDDPCAIRVWEHSRYHLAP